MDTENGSQGGGVECGLTVQGHWEIIGDELLCTWI